MAIYQNYLSQLRADFTKIAKLEFLNPDGSVAYVLDNNALNKRSFSSIGNYLMQQEQREAPSGYGDAYQSG